MKRVPTYVSPEASHFPEVGLKEHPSAPQPSGPPPTPKRSQPVPSARPPPSSHSPPASQCVGIVTSPSPPGPQGRQMCLSSILRLRLTGSRDTGGGGAILHQGLAPQPASRPGCAEGDKLETTHSLEMPPPRHPPGGGAWAPDHRRTVTIPLGGAIDRSESLNIKKQVLDSRWWESPLKK